MGGVYFCAKYIYFSSVGVRSRGEGRVPQFNTRFFSFLLFVFFITIGALTQGSSSGATYLDPLEGLSAILLFCYNACISVTHVSRIHTSACCRIYIYCMLRSLIRDGSDFVLFFYYLLHIIFSKKKKEKMLILKEIMYILSSAPLGGGVLP